MTKNMKTTKLLIAAILVTAIATTVGCKKPLYDGPNSFILSIEEVEFVGDSIFLGEFNGDRRLISIDVGLSTAADHWEAITPTAHDWIAFSRHGNRILLTVGENRTNQPRWSWFEFSIGENTRRIHVYQDYVRWISFAVGEELVVGAPSGSDVLEIVTNAAFENLVLTVNNHETDEWVTDIVLENGELRFNFGENPSLDDKRHFTFTVSAEGTSGKVTLSQNQLSGEPYVIDISGVDWEESYVFEMWDPINEVVIGKLCLEYLHKHNPPAEPVVRKRTVVAYPMMPDGFKVNLSSGLDVQNGHFITWNSNVTRATPPHDILAVYTPGENINPGTPTTTMVLREIPHEITVPTKIYLARGASRMTTIEFDVPEEDRVHVELRPFILRDQRTGPANNHGQTHEDFTYRIVKIGTQFWTAENLRTTRWSDNNENIPTGWDQLEPWLNGMFPAVQIAIREHSDMPGRQTTLRRDANDPHPDTMAIRMRYGVLYNFHAMTRTHGVLGVEIPASQITDKLSPANSPWNIPRLNDFRILAAYAYQTTLLPPLGSQATLGKLSGYTPEAYPHTDPLRRGPATNVTGFTALGNVSRSNTATGTNGGTMFLIIDGYNFRSTRVQAFEQHWMSFFAVETQNVAETGHYPLQRAGQSCHRGKYVRLILDL
jgi:hypothetical protein